MKTKANGSKCKKNKGSKKGLLPAKAAGISQAQEKFVKVFSANNGNIAKTCQELGIVDSLAYRYLNNIEVKKQIAQNLEYCKRALEASAPQVIQGLMEMFMDKSTPPQVRAAIGNGLLDRAGLEKPQNNQITVNINTEISDRARQILAERVGEVPVDAEYNEVK